MRWALAVVALALFGACGEDDARGPWDRDGAAAVSDAGSSSRDASASEARPLDGESGAPAVRIIGRVDDGDPAGPRFSWSGSAVVARFSGDSVGVRLRDPGNQFEVLVDDRPLATLVASGGRELYPLQSGLGPGPLLVQLVRRTEGFLGATQLLGLVLDPAGALLPPPPAAVRRLEFVGDSITCGYGVEGADQYCPFSADTENFTLSFAALTARALGAEATAIAVSGRGLYRNFDGTVTGTVPQLYDRTLQDGFAVWDFTRFTPDAVVINLGTNDFAKGDPGPPFADAYEAFLRRVRGHYPTAHIVCTAGPMLGTDELARVRGYLAPLLDAARAAGDARLSYLEFPTQDGSLGYGCDWHPSRGTHQQMADRLTAELRQRLGW